MSSVNRCEKGVTLLELVIGVAMATVSVVVLTLIFPKASANISTTRQRWLANNLAVNAIQEIKQNSYSAITPTSANPIYFPYGGGVPVPITTAGGCDCTRVDFAALPDNGVFQEDGVTYTRKVCINLVDRPLGVWTSFCPDTPPGMQTDFGLKNIRVRVSWRIGTHPYTSDAESQVAR